MRFVASFLSLRCLLISDSGDGGGGDPPTDPPTDPLPTIEDVIAAAMAVADHRKSLGMAVTVDSANKATHDASHTKALAEKEDYAAAFNTLETVALRYEKDDVTVE